MTSEVKIKRLLLNALKKSQGINKAEVDEIGLELPRNSSNEHGDFSSNIALKLAGKLKRSPLMIAEEIIDKIVDDCGISEKNLTVILTPTRSLCGTTQVVGRVLEVGLHKVHELGFPIDKVVDGFGSAPLPPPAPDFLIGMGRTNDAILYENDPTGYEFIFNGFRQHHYITWIKEKSQISHVPSPIYGGSAGIQTIRVAHTYYPKDIKYLIGFDVFGERDNMYDGTNGYPSEGTANNMTDEFIEGFKDLLNIYDETKSNLFHIQ